MTLEIEDTGHGTTPRNDNLYASTVPYTRCITRIRADGGTMQRKVTCGGSFSVRVLLERLPSESFLIIAIHARRSEISTH